MPVRVADTRVALTQMARANLDCSLHARRNGGLRRQLRSRWRVRMVAFVASKTTRGALPASETCQWQRNLHNCRYARSVATTMSLCYRSGQIFIGVPFGSRSARSALTAAL